MSLIPLGPETIGAAIGSIITTAFNLGTLARNIADAPEHIQRICLEAETCRTTVLSLKILLLENENNGLNKDAQELIHVASLIKTLVALEDTLQLLEKEVGDLMAENMRIGNSERARWAWKSDEIKELLRCLDSHKLTLNITLNILNLHHTKELKRYYAELLDRIVNTGREDIVSDSGRPLAAAQLSEVKVLSSRHKEQRTSETQSIISDHTQVIPQLPPIMNSPSLIRGLDPVSSGPAVMVSSYNFSSMNDTTFRPEFEEVLFASRVYRNTKSRQKSRQQSPLSLAMTWSELHNSGASILSYRLRTPFSATLRASTLRISPMVILTRDQKRLNDAFINAIKKKDLGAMSTLLDLGADLPDAAASKTSKSQPESLVSTALALACGYKQAKYNVKLIKFFLDHTNIVNMVIPEIQTTPLSHAVAVGNAALVEVLLAYGADTEEADSNGDTILSLAIRHCQIPVQRPKRAGGSQPFDIVGMLLHAGANMQSANKHGETALHVAVKQDSLEIIRLLLERGADVNAPDSTGDTPLFYAQTIGVVKLLKQFGANLDITNEGGEAALHVAAKRGDMDIMKSMLELGALVNPPGVTGETLLLSPITLEAAEALVRAGANLQARNEKGETPAYVATKRNQTDVLKFLLEHGAKVDMPDFGGETALHVATACGNIGIMRILLEHGADANASDIHDPPIFSASTVDALMLLLQFRANVNGENSLEAVDSMIALLASQASNKSKN